MLCLVPIQQTDGKHPQSNDVKIMESYEKRVMANILNQIMCRLWKVTLR